MPIEDVAGTAIFPFKSGIFQQRTAPFQSHANSHDSYPGLTTNLNRKSTNLESIGALSAVN